MTASTAPTTPSAVSGGASGAPGPPRAPHRRRRSARRSRARGAPAPAARRRAPRRRSSARMPGLLVEERQQRRQPGPDPLAPAAGALDTRAAPRPAARADGLVERRQEALFAVVEQLIERAPRHPRARHDVRHRRRPPPRARPRPPPSPRGSAGAGSPRPRAARRPPDVSRLGRRRACAPRPARCGRTSSDRRRPTSSLALLLLRCFLCLALAFFLALGQPVTAILVFCLICAPFCPVSVVGIVRLCAAEAALGLRGQDRREPGVRPLGQLQLERADRRVGDAANVLLVMPFLMSMLPDEVERDAFALEDHHEVGERRATVRHQVRRARHRVREHRGAAPSRSRSSTPPGTTRGSRRTSLPGRPAGSSSAARAAAWAASPRPCGCSPAPAAGSRPSRRGSHRSSCSSWPAWRP